jgi:hypothetical protein
MQIREKKNTTTRHLKKEISTNTRAAAPRRRRGKS